MKGRYEVAPNLKPLGTDFGNGESDAVLFELDSDFKRYRANKEDAYADSPAKYFAIGDVSAAVSLAVAEAFRDHLARDYPSEFESGESFLTSRLTGEAVAWTPRGALDVPGSSLSVTVKHLFEALAFQIQADLALVARDPDGNDRVVAVHVCAPSHWHPAEKLGQSFFQTHTVVPGFDRINAAAPKMVDAMIKQGPFIRFVWGVESDTRLNHHPEPSSGWDFVAWDGRAFDQFPFCARVERQTLLGLPAVDAALFVIHAKTIPGKELSAEERAAMLAAVQSMSPEALRYKGLDRHYQALVQQLSRST